MFWSIKKSVPKVLFWNKSRKKTMQFMHKKAIKMEEKRKNGKENGCYHPSTLFNPSCNPQ